jgi:hypothetical protein
MKYGMLEIIKRIFILSGLALSLLIVSSCATNKTSKPKFVELVDLIAIPERYNGKNIRSNGIYVRGFECSALGVSTYKKDNAVYLTEPTIWIESANIESKTNCFTMDLFPPAEFCTIKISGIFEYGDRYGHLGGYKFQIRGKSK